MKAGLKPIIIALLSICGCSGSDTKATEGKSLVSAWAGNYSSAQGQGNGLISNWKLFSDDTFTGTWTSAAGSMSIACLGTYSLNGTEITWTTTGTATNASLSPKTSPFSGTGTGALDATAGTGTYSISFSDWGTVDSGDWSVSKE